MNKINKEFLVRSVIYMIGIVILIFGVSVFISLDLGGDAFTVMVMGISNQTGLSIGISNMALNLISIIAIYFIDRKSIRAGTIMIFLFLGMGIDIGLGLIGGFFVGMPMPVAIVCIILNCFVVAFSVAILISANIGASAYDLYGIIVAERTKFELKLARPICDLVLIVVGVVLGGKLGIGTFIIMILIGPLLQFCLKYTGKYVEIAVIKFAKQEVLES